MKIYTVSKKIFGAIALITGFFLFLFTCSFSWGDEGAKNQLQKNPIEAVVVSQPSDPYYSLAQKIARAENLSIIEDFSKITDLNPRYIIWVASPDNLTGEKLLDIGRIFKDSNYYPGLGIISGSTIEKAEQLWNKKDLVQKGNDYLGSDADKSQLLSEPTIFNINHDISEKIELNKNNLIDVLKKADYFYWVRHVGTTTWYWNSESENWGENDELFAKDIPALKPVVIYTPSCNSFRPWVQNSIALGFIDNGAAAYIGNVNSPFHTNSFIKNGLYVPGLTSWKEFPLGLVTQIQNRVETKTLFKIPQFFMLGDPRIYLMNDQPYQIISDTKNENGKRIIDGVSDEDGFLAVKIDNGAEYNFLTIQGLTSASENDIFYNNKLQTLNLGADKYILFFHKGGKFQIELSPKAPVGWLLTDTLSDAFDYSWVVLWLNVQVTDSPFIYTVSLLIFITILLFKLIKRKKSIKDYKTIFIIAFLLAFLQLVYFYIRKDVYTVSSNFIEYTPSQIVLGCFGIFANVAGGLMLLKDAKKILVKSLGVIFAVLPQFLLTGFYLAFITLMNNLTQINKMTMPWLWNYNSFWLPLIVLTLEVTLILTLYRIFIFTGKRNSGLS